MPKRSAGLLLYRVVDGGLAILLVHPGGPLWARKDLGAWSVPKGEYDENEEPLAVAVREFEEETGAAPDVTAAVPLGSVRQRGGKVVTAWAVEGDFDPETLRSNTFEMRWPPRSDTVREFPEVDRAEWFGVAQAREKVVPAQVELIDRLVAIRDDSR